MAIPDSFLRKVAAQVGVPDSAYSAFAQFMNRWQPYEGGHTNNSAKFNYLNTTDSTGAIGTMNGVGVSVFPNEDAGAAATARTFLSGSYNNLLRAFRTGDYSNVSGIAGDVRTWTSGSPTGHSNFATVLQGGQAGAESWAGGGSSMASTSASNGFDITSILSNYPPPDPKDFPDPLDYQSAVGEWAKTIASLASAAKSLDPSATTDPAQQKFDNDISTFGQQLQQGQLDLNTAGARIDRMLKGMAESRSRADSIAAGQKQIQQYGVPAGKTSFSAQDLGGSFAGVAQAMGLKPTDSLINYSGTQYIDPAADIANYDKALGVNGPLPDVHRPAALDLGVPQWATDQLGDAAKGTQDAGPKLDLNQNGQFFSQPNNPIVYPTSYPGGTPTRVTFPNGTTGTSTAPSTPAPHLNEWTIDPATGKLRPPALPASFAGLGF